MKKPTENSSSIEIKQNFTQKRGDYNLEMLKKTTSRKNKIKDGLKSKGKEIDWGER